MRDNAIRISAVCPVNPPADGANPVCGRMGCVQPVPDDVTRRQRRTCGLAAFDPIIGDAVASVSKTRRCVFDTRDCAGYSPCVASVQYNGRLHPFDCIAQNTVIYRRCRRVAEMARSSSRQTQGTALMGTRHQNGQKARQGVCRQHLASYLLSGILTAQAVQADRHLDLAGQDGDLAGSGRTQRSVMFLISSFAGLFRPNQGFPHRLGRGQRDCPRSRFTRGILFVAKALP